MFNILSNQVDFEELKVLDLFCGTGNIAYECVSRGCVDTTCVDKFYGCIKFVKETAKELGLDDELKVIKSDVFKFIKNAKTTYDFIFADPPYALPKIEALPDLIFEHELLSDEGCFVMEHSSRNKFEAHPNFDFSRRYGDSVFSFFKNIDKEIII